MRRVEIPAISSTAARNEESFVLDGLLKPLIFLTNCSDAARISSSVTGGSKLKSVLMFLHISLYLQPEYLVGLWHWCFEKRRDDRKQQIGAGQNAKMRGAWKHGELGMWEAAHRAVHLAT